LLGVVCSQIEDESEVAGLAACGSLLGGAGVQERYLAGKARGLIAAYRAEITLSLRITVAGLIGLALGELASSRSIGRC
jgi:hypothetical protein